jgi:hypothetical protein
MYLLDKNEQIRLKCLFVLKYASPAPSWMKKMRKYHWAIICDFV